MKSLFNLDTPKSSAEATGKDYVEPLQKRETIVRHPTRQEIRKDVEHR